MCPLLLCTVSCCNTPSAAATQNLKPHSVRRCTHAVSRCVLLHAKTRGCGPSACAKISGLLASCSSVNCNSNRVTCGYLAFACRPPAGFMGDNVQDPSLNTQDPQVLISKLRSNAGHWHQLGKLLPILYSKGIDSNMVAELTGINPADQNSWIVAGTVYDSIAAGGKVRKGGSG